MNGPRHRAWRFALPYPADPESAGGLQLTPAGRIAMVEGEASVRQSLLLLLSTTPGERVMRPAYGCDLRRLVFSANDETTAGLAMHYVRQAVELWEPRVEILRLDAGTAVAPIDEGVAGRTGTGAALAGTVSAAGRLEIALEYRVRGTGRAGTITYSLDLSEGA